MNGVMILEKMWISNKTIYNRELKHIKLENNIKHTRNLIRFIQFRLRQSDSPRLNEVFRAQIGQLYGIFLQLDFTHNEDR